MHGGHGRAREEGRFLELVDVGGPGRRVHPLAGRVASQRRPVDDQAEAGCDRVGVRLLDDEDELTLKEIGDKYNLSRERIRQLQEQALTKIRKQMRDY